MSIPGSEGFEPHALEDFGIISDPKELHKIRESDHGKRVADWILQQTTKCESARNVEKLRWYRNLSLFENRPEAKIGAPGSILGNTLYMPPQARNQVRKEKVNRIKPIVRTEIARLVSQKPNSFAVPATGEDQDMRAAKAAEQILQSQYDKHNLRKEFMRTAFWLSLTGNGFMKTFWDQSTFDKYSSQQGDIVYNDVSPFNLLIPDLRAYELDCQPYVVHMYTRPIEWLYTFFGDRLQDIVLTPTAHGASTFMDEAYYNLSRSKESQPDSCVVREIWLKPGATRMLPQGGLITMVDNHILQYCDTGIPYEHGDYPFTHFTHVPSSGFYASSVVTELEGLQLEYNELLTQIADARRKMGKPQFISPKGSISAAKMTNTTGLVIEYRPGMQPPTPIPLTQLPGYFFEEQNRIITDMEDLSGQHQVSKGNAPPGVTAATAIGFLQERDESYMAPTYGSVEYGFQKVGRQTLALARQFWTLPRVVKVVGEDGVWDVTQFMGSDLTEGTDIRVEPGSALPESKAARMAAIMDLMNQGHIPSEEGLGLLEVGGVTKLVDNLQVDKRQAMHENLYMRKLTEEQVLTFDLQWQQAAQQGAEEAIDPETGQPLQPPPVVPVNSWDNHEVHIEVHNRYRKSQMFSALPDFIKAVFERHVNDHMAMLQIQAMQQALMSIPSDGSDPTAPDADEPMGSLGDMLTGGEAEGESEEIEEPMLPGMEDM